jgi:cell division protein FtsL
MSTLLYRTLEEYALLSSTSVEAILRSWIDEHARPTVSEEGRKIRERCRLMKEWQSLGFTDKEPDVKYFARRLAGV